MVAEQLIHESKKSKSYLLEDLEFGRPVLLKILNYEFPTPKEIAQFYNKFEIINGLKIKEVRFASNNLYLLGLVLYKMLTGTTPIEGLGPLVIEQVHIAGKPEPLKNRNSNSPMQISEIIDILLSKNSESRYQSTYGLNHFLGLYQLIYCMVFIHEYKQQTF